MKVYAVLHDWSSDYEHGVDLLGIFFDKNKAAKLFNTKRIDELHYANDNDFVIETDTSDCFDAYEDGYYAKDHTTITLIECVIEDGECNECD